MAWHFRQRTRNGQTCYYTRVCVDGMKSQEGIGYDEDEARRELLRRLDGIERESTARRMTVAAPVADYREEPFKRKRETTQGREAGAVDAFA